MMSACIVAAQLVMLAIALLVGRTADRWGRKPTRFAVNSARWSRKTPGAYGRGWKTFPLSFAPTQRAAIPSLSPTSSSGLFLATTPSAASRRRQRVSSWNLDSPAQC